VELRAEGNLEELPKLFMVSQGSVLVFSDYVVCGSRIFA
jgi:hypothetical protein